MVAALLEETRMVKRYGWNDLDPEIARLLRMPKDVRDGNYSRKWPQPGSGESIELIAEDERELRFFLDIREGGRSSSLSIGIAQGRRSKMQTRASDHPLMRVDYADEAALLKHRNPDGVVITGNHVHLGISTEPDVPCEPNIPWAFPIAAQDVVSPVGGINVASLFWAFQDACGITRELNVEQLLGV